MSVVTVTYEEWHPEGDLLWERLEIPTQTNRLGGYKNPQTFEQELYWDARARNHISYKEILTYFDRQFSAAFVLEHYGAHILGKHNPKVLEIGAWPMRNTTVAAQFNNSLIGILSRNPDYKIVGVDSIDVQEALGFKTYDPPYFGTSTFLNGNFFENKVRAQIVLALGGLPDIIVGNMVFERRLGNWLAKDTDGPDRPEAAEKITRAAISFMPDQGSLLICNRSSGTIPDAAQSLPLVALYLNDKGQEFAQIRQREKTQ